MVFTRNPVPGRVKTRIGRVMGDEVAMQVHRRLSQHTRSVVQQLACDKSVWLDGPPAGDWWWSEGMFQVNIQRGSDLGERMANAFLDEFRSGYRKVIIIGTDCPGITTSILDKSIFALDEVPAVIGPAADGGYYLLGLTGFIPELFSGKAWGTATVFQDTISDLDRSGHVHRLLPELPDVDRPEDLIHLQGLP